MKKRLEDRLIEVAFGDRTELTASEQAATPEAAARLKEYRLMRSALSQLREMPDHQLSTERLRERLLHQGLKRRRSFPWQALGYGIAACSLFVCAFYVSRDVRRITARPPVVLGAAPVKLNVDEPSFADLFGSTAEPHNTDAATKLSSPRPVRQRFTPSRNRDLALNGGDGSLVKLVTHPLTSDSPQRPVSDISAKRVAPRAAAASSAVTPPPVAIHAATVTDAMVLIQPKTDADSGLDTAQEVTATGNVLVGG
ncbi:MAG: hypothetical protein ACYC96_07605 [Fimbriimonadaceae bacterium]